VRQAPAAQPWRCGADAVRTNDGMTTLQIQLQRPVTGDSVAEPPGIAVEIRLQHPRAAHPAGGLTLLESPGGQVEIRWATEEG